MRSLPFLALLGGCATFSDATDLTYTFTFPPIDASCEPASRDDSSDTIRLLTEIAADGSVCRGRAFGSTVAIDWSDVENEVPPHSHVEWTSVEAIPVGLTLTGGVPAGTVLRVEELMATEAGALLGYEADPFARADTIGGPVEGSDEILLRLEHTFGTTTPDDLLAAAQLTTNEGGPLDVLNTSYAADRGVQVILVATLEVPTAELTSAISPRLDLAQDIAYGSSIRATLRAPRE